MGLFRAFLSIENRELNWLVPAHVQGTEKAHRIVCWMNDPGSADTDVFIKTKDADVLSKPTVSLFPCSGAVGLWGRALYLVSVRWDPEPWSRANSFSSSLGSNGRWNLHCKTWSFPSFGHFSSPFRNQGRKQCPFTQSLNTESSGPQGSGREGWCRLPHDGLREGGSSSLGAHPPRPRAAEMLPRPCHLHTPGPTAQRDRHTWAFLHGTFIHTVPFRSLASWLAAGWGTFSRLSPWPASKAVFPWNLSWPLCVHVASLSFWPQPHVAGPSFSPSQPLTNFLISWLTEHGSFILSPEDVKV